MNTLELLEPERISTRTNDVVLLPYGLLGFERVKNYSLLAKPAQDPYLWLQMLEEAKHAFLVLPPSAILANYQPDFEYEDVEFLELNETADALILNIVTMRESGPATVNLKGPIVINRRTWIGKQVIPNNAAQYPTRHPLSFS